MATVSCTIDEIELEHDSGRMIKGVQAVCDRCGHTTESFGTSDASVRRCLALMREECPGGEHNFYEGEL
jgi:tRNA(Ile2) C34 agmatinyltransferase TiaS